MSTVVRLLLVILFICEGTCAESLIDFETDAMSDFVIETKKIDIPGFPDAFNPSIVPFQDALLMSFRTRDGGHYSPSGESGDYDDEANSFLMSFRFRNRNNADCAIDATSHKAGLTCKNQIGLVLLNKHFEPISWPQILDIHYSSPIFTEAQQDPRLVYVGNRLFMIFSNLIQGDNRPTMRRMFAAELFYRSETFFVSEPVSVLSYDGSDEQIITKNWVPFAFEEGLNLAYNINPHVVFRYRGSSNAETLANTSAKLNWDYGALRGGTPAIAVEDCQYLAFFHSSKEMKSAHSGGVKMQHYFMGAYTFSCAPPFGLTSISKSPIIGKNFFHGPVYQTWKPLRVVFPAGIIVGKDKVWVAYGRQDHEAWIATIDKKKLRDSMVPVEQSSCQSGS